MLIKTHTFLAITTVFLSLVAGAIAQDNKEQKESVKLSADEIVNRHLASIGSAQAISAVKSRVMVGVGSLAAKSAVIKKIGGPAQFASQGSSLLLAMMFNATDYPYEKIGFDGKDLTNGIILGNVTSLGAFLRSNKALLKNGFFGGVLSTDWALLQPDKSLRLESVGTGKIDGKSVYKVKASAPGVGDLSITLYFDSETFRHIRSEYYFRTGQLLSPSPAATVQIISSAPTEFTVTEDFSNFTKVDDLVLPLLYTITYEAQGVDRTRIWTINFTQIYNNQALDASAFHVS